MEVTVGTHVYTVSLWWAAVVVWLAVSTVLLVRELMEKAQEERRSRQRSRQSAEDFFRRYGTAQGTPRQSVTIRPWAVVRPGGASPSAPPPSPPRSETNPWRLRLSVTAEIAGILGLFVALVVAPQPHPASAESRRTARTHKPES
ncbi:hypothetical protein ABZ819_35255 [Streptomyces venezuelae]|uniref:hypothetical protein n=1 Tax=Streptomyces venezuelae TaxID=54571 RepID=UPI00341D0DD1